MSVPPPNCTPNSTSTGSASCSVRCELAETAARKAQMSQNPTTVEPGRYTVVLEPTAVANLLQLMRFALNARTADEGRSFFSKRDGGNRIGEKILDEHVTITSDPWDPELL